MTTKMRSIVFAFFSLKRLLFGKIEFILYDFAVMNVRESFEEK